MRNMSIVSGSFSLHVEWSVMPSNLCCAVPSTSEVVPSVSYVHSCINGFQININGINSPHVCNLCIN